MTDKEYRIFLINGILEFQTQNQFTEEELKKKPTRILEKIYDNI